MFRIHFSYFKQIVWNNNLYFVIRFHCWKFCINSFFNRWPEIFSCGQLYVALSRATSMDGLYIDGSLEKIKVLASEDFLNFQNNALDTCVNSTNSEEVPVSEEQPEDTTKEPSASDGRTISIKCPAHAAKAIFSFAQALTPDTKLVDSVLILPEEYKQAVKTFIEVIL